MKNNLTVKILTDSLGDVAGNVLGSVPLGESVDGLQTDGFLRVKKREKNNRKTKSAQETTINIT